ncbi:MAG TPA: cyclic nucleotide-binding domain-containing protein [bacterium]|nr:cyclic nucleotide-binding domain-containing protein [bacterium]
MTRKQRVALLRGVTLFAGLGPRALGEIADLMEEITFPAGRYIVRQGQVGTGFYLVTSGRARVERGDRVLNTLGPGDFFGELSVLDQSPRIAHVRTEEPTTVLALASWDFTRMLERNPKVTLAILKEVARRLRETTDAPTH